MRGAIRGWLPAFIVIVLACGVTTARAQEPADSEETRTAALARAKAEKTKAVHPYEPTKAEALIDRAEDLLFSGELRWHPFFESAYAGGGFTLGAGYRRYVSSYNTIDLRGSITFSGYKRLEAEFLAPRLFNRRGVLSVIGGWREATSVGFYGIGTTQTSHDDRANYSFKQPYVADVLIKRRDAIGRAYLTAINPVVNPALSASGTLTFGNAAVERGFAEAPDSYLAVWSTLDNATGASTHIADTAGRDQVQAPSGLPSGSGSYVKVALSAVSTSHPAWAQPIEVYFRKVFGGWKLVGLERMPNRPAAGTEERGDRGEKR